MQRPWVTSAAYELAIGVMIAARREAGLTQRALAERIGKPRSFISKLESRERRLDMVELVVLSKALGVAPEALMVRIATALPAEIDI